MARELGVCSVRASSSLLMRCVLGRWDRGWHLITWASMQCHLLLKHEGLGYQAWQGLCTTGVGSPSFRGEKHLWQTGQQLVWSGWVFCIQGGTASLGLVLLQCPDTRAPF